MSPHVGCSRSMSSYLVHCQEEPMRFLNGLKISPQLAAQSGQSFSRTVDCRILIVHIWPFVIDTRVFLTSCRPWRHSASYYGSRTTCCDRVGYNAEMWRVYYDIFSSSNGIYTTMLELSASFVRDYHISSGSHDIYTTMHELSASFVRVRASRKYEPHLCPAFRFNAEITGRTSIKIAVFLILRTNMPQKKKKGKGKGHLKKTQTSEVPRNTPPALFSREEQSDDDDDEEGIQDVVHSNP